MPNKVAESSGPLSGFRTGGRFGYYVLMSDKIVSGPELKTTLTGLGLTPKWFASRLGVSMRTVIRWFDSAAIPDNAARELGLIYDFTLSEMRNVRTKYLNDGFVSTFRTSADISSGGSMPASWHRALAFRVVEHLRANDHDVTVSYVDPGS